MVNKYRVKGDQKIMVYNNTIFTYDPISDLYRGKELGITKELIFNINQHGAFFEPVPEFKVGLTETQYDHQGDRHVPEVFTFKIEIPKGISLSASKAQELIYNALNAQK